MMRFHHLGIACENISKALDFIHENFAVVHKSDSIYDPNQDAELCIVQTLSGLNIELIAGNQVRTYVKKGIHLYHTCWEVDNITEAVAKLSSQGMLLISEPKEAIIFQSRKVAFLYSPLGLLELIEK